MAEEIQQAPEKAIVEYPGMDEAIPALNTQKGNRRYRDKHRCQRQRDRGGNSP